MEYLAPGLVAGDREDEAPEEHHRTNEDGEKDVGELRLGKSVSQ